MHEAGPRYHRSRQPHVRHQGRRRASPPASRNPSASPSRDRGFRAAAIIAPVSHQKRSQRDETNTIEHVKSSRKSTPAILVPPLITVWLEVRVLPGPPRIHTRTRFSGDSSVSPQLAGVACERSVSAKEKLN